MADAPLLFSEGLPKYQAIAQHYEKAIVSGTLQAGDRLPSERDLAARWDITAMTVRQALDVLRKKQLIVRKQGHGTFVTAPPAPAAHAGKTMGTVQVLGMMPSDSTVLRRVNWQPRMRRYQGLVDASFRHGIVLQSNLIIPRDASSVQLVELLQESAGLVLHDEVLPEVVLAGLAEAGLPMVAVNCYPQVDYCSRLLIDSRRGAFSAVRHLAELGHTNIGIIVGDPQRYSMGLRLTGYRDAHSLLNLPLREDYILIEPRGLEEDGAEACRQLLALPDPPTAIFAASDRRAIGIIEAADLLGISIPGDLSLIGFDDLAESAATTPALTTLHNPLYESGEQAIDLLVSLIKQETHPGAMSLMPARLVERSSTAPPQT